MNKRVKWGIIIVIGAAVIYFTMKDDLEASIEALLTASDSLNPLAINSNTIATICIINITRKLSQSIIITHFS